MTFRLIIKDSENRAVMIGSSSFPTGVHLGKAKAAYQNTLKQEKESTKRSEENDESVKRRKKRRKATLKRAKTKAKKDATQDS